MVSLVGGGRTDARDARFGNGYSAALEKDEPDGKVVSPDAGPAGDDEPALDPLTHDKDLGTTHGQQE